MKITVRAGVRQSPAEIYDLAADANRAVLLYDIAVRENLKREQYDDGEGTYHVAVTADSEKILPLLAPIVAGEGFPKTAAYRCEWDPAEAVRPSEDEDDAERRAQEVWERHGPDGSGAVYLMEEV